MTPAFLVQVFPPDEVRFAGNESTHTLELKEHNDMNKIKSFLNDESGMETLEYAVIAGLIAVAAAIIYASSGTWATTIKNRLQNAAAQS